VSKRLLDTFFFFCREEPGERVCVTLSLPSSVQHIFWLAPDFMLHCFMYNPKYMSGLNLAPSTKSRTGADATLRKAVKTQDIFIWLFSY